MLIEDSPTDAAVIQANLVRAFPGVQVCHHTQLASAIDFLKHGTCGFSCDFIILDLNLADSQGLDSLRRLTEVCSDTAILVCTAHEDDAMAREAVKMGAQDYLIKGRGNADTLKRIMEYAHERVQAQRQRIMNEQLLSALVKYSPAGLVVLDKQLRIMLASDRWRAAHDQVKLQFDHTSISSLRHYQDYKWKELFQRCLNAEAISCAVDEWHDQNEAIRYVRWEMLPWFDTFGRIGGMIMLLEDITQAQQLQKQLEEANATLEKKVHERTKELVSAMIMTESAQAAKDEFFANMTHELRTPLHAIINFSRFGIKKAATATPEKLTEYFSDIHASGNRLLGLVNDLLDLTKHKYGRAAINAEQHLTDTLFTAVAHETSAILENKAMSLHCDISPNAQQIACDGRRIHQVLLNLLGNAIKFSPPGTTIQLKASHSHTTARTQDMPDMVVISVLDQGPGIPEAELETVFDEFFQSSKVKSGEFAKGTGLGLAICKQIVQSHGGMIWAENRPEGGAAVHFVLPSTLSAMGPTNDSQEVA